MNILKIINISGYSAPITGLALFIWGAQAQMLNIDKTGGDFANEDARLIAGFFLIILAGTKDVCGE